MAELKPMTIDEHIKHHLDLEKMWENGAKRAKDDGLIYAFEMHTMIATDHRHLADWLTELKAYRKLDICGNCRHYVGGTRHFGECHATSDIEPTVVCVNQASCETYFRYKDFLERRIEDDTL